MTAKGSMVVALGGNAISREFEEGNVDQQFANSRATARQLADLIEDGWHLIITHGNGPQIGNFLLRNEAAAGLIYPLPMEVAVAHVQGGMGFMIAQTLTNELHARGDGRFVVPIIWRTARASSAREFSTVLMYWGTASTVKTLMMSTTTRSSSRVKPPRPRPAAHSRRPPTRGSDCEEARQAGHHLVVQRQGHRAVRDAEGAP
jgi:carbamate kinase